MRRRAFLLAVPAAVLPGRAGAAKEEVAALVRAVAGGEPRAGRVVLDLPQLVENGNAVAMTVALGPDAPAGAVLTDIHVFADGNPRPEVAHFRFGPLAGTPVVSTRVRLATSQTVTAVALFADGTAWQDSVDLVVTWSACLD